MAIEKGCPDWRDNIRLGGLGGGRAGQGFIELFLETGLAASGVIGVKDLFSAGFIQSGDGLFHGFFPTGYVTGEEELFRPGDICFYLAARRNVPLMPSGTDASLILR